MSFGFSSSKGRRPMRLGRCSIMRGLTSPILQADERIITRLFLNLPKVPLEGSMLQITDRHYRGEGTTTVY